MKQKAIVKYIKILAIAFFYIPLNVLAQKDTVIDAYYNLDKIKEEFKQHYTTNKQQQVIIKIINNELDIVDIIYLGYDNKIHKGQILCNKKVATQVQQIFAYLLSIQFQIYQAKPISNFRFNDNISMQANNTSCFDFRLQTNSHKRLSKHAYGLAIDINPLQNPYKTKEEIIPTNANDKMLTGNIILDTNKGKKVIAIFKKYGWRWGGYFKRSKDLMHFEK